MYLTQSDFLKHNIAGLNSVITFIVLLQPGEASTVEGNKHTHTHDDSKYWSYLQQKNYSSEIKLSDEVKTEL